MNTLSISIDKRNVVRDYGFDGMEAIIDHPEHGRLLIMDGYGGEHQLRGGMVRWEHGMAIQLLPDDDFALLMDQHNEHTSIYEAAINGWRKDRPLLDWSGLAIASVAKKAGL